MAPIAALASDLVGIVVELFAIPLRASIAAVKLLGRALALVWRAVVAVGSAVGRAGRAALAVAERSVTPARAIAVAIVVAAGAVVAAQFADYRAVAIGTEDYAGVGAASAAPEVARETAGSAHGYALLPVAGVALALGWLAFVGRLRRGASLIALAGLAIVAVSALVDAPAGLDEGRAAIAYEGAEARLLGPFWAQLFGGAVLIATGALLAARRRARAAAPGRAASAGEVPSPVEPWGAAEPRGART